MRHIKAPGNIPNKGFKIFLAGSIEMGAAEKWQDRAAAMLELEDVIVLNPRRDDWDSSWVQSIKHYQFREQVEWELQGIEEADKIIVYFDPETKAPITLLELGFVAGYHDPEKIIVVCPEGFYRKGNVDIVCHRYSLEQADTLEQAVVSIKREIEGDSK